MQTYAVEYFVSPDGSDAGPGTATQPYATLEKAQASVRALKSGAGIPAGGVAVTLLDGFYPRSSTLALTSADSGAADRPVVWRGYPGHDVRLVAGQSLTGWAQVTQSSVPASIWNRLHPAAKSGSSSSLWFARLSEVGVTRYGDSIDGRPAMQRPGGNSGVASPGGQVRDSDGALMELFYGGSSAGVLGRYPNAALFSQGAWIQSAYPSGSSMTFPSQARASAWAGAMALGTMNQPWAHVWWGEWNDSFTAVTSLSATSASFASGTPSGGGSSAVSGLFFSNLLEEVDSAGEYWIDRDAASPTAGYVFFYPPGGTHPTAGGGEVVVSTFAGPVVSITGSYITVQGMTIEASQKDCVALAGSRNTLSRNTIRNCAGANVQVDGAGHAIDRNVLRNAGAWAVRETTATSGLVFTNNDVSEWGRYHSWTAWAIAHSGNGCSYAHNRFHDGSGGAFYVLGSNTLIELNEFGPNVNREGSDSGVFYTAGTGNVSATIRYNYFHDLGTPCKPGSTYSTTVVYSDDNANNVSPGWSVYGNVLYGIGKASAAGSCSSNMRYAFQSKGSANLFQNNLVVKADGTASRNSGTFTANQCTGGATDNCTSRAPSPAFTAESASPRDLSNGNGRFTSTVFVTDPNGLDYIPWSQIGVQP